MNIIETSDDDRKLFVVREYHNGPNPDSSNDILEYLYDIRDVMNEYIDKEKDRLLKEIHNRKGHIGPNYNFAKVSCHPSLRNQIHVTVENLKKIESIIEDVINSDKSMFAVVWSIKGFSITNPRLIYVQETQRDVYRFCFDPKRLLHLSDEVYKARTLSITDPIDTYTVLRIIDDPQLEDHYDFWNIHNIFGQTGSSIDNTLSLNQRANKIYIYADSNINNAIEAIDSLNEDIVKCKECGKYFLIQYNERLWYTQRGLSIPKRCPRCRKNS